MKASEVVFQQLLDGKLQYCVPLFQRTYSWSEEHWERLWDDILEIYSMEQPRSHFIGAVVTQPIPDAPEKAAKFMLIDGQQRLITLLLLLAVIKEAAQDSSQTLADEITDTCLINKYALASSERFKLLPTQLDRNAFSSAMEGKVPDQSTQIGKARRYFNDMVKRGDLEGTPLDLTKMKRCITHYLDIVSIKLEQGDSPNRIFESLNNTGMKLGASDLIRNHLFMNIEPGAQEGAYTQYWIPMQEALQGRLDDFFWRFLMMDGGLPRWDEIFDAVKDSLGDLSSDDALNALEKFTHFSKHYLRLNDPSSHEMDNQIRTQMEHLNAWEVGVAYPFLMHMLERLNCGAITHQDFLAIEQMIESFLVRRTVCGVPANRLRRIFAPMSSNIDLHNIVESSRQYLIANRWPSDAEFSDRFITFRLYIPGRLARTRLVLDSLERSFGHKEIPAMTPNITIEHIMPQTLTSEWREMLGTNAKEVHDRWLDSVGNLTLSGYNPELSNKPFDQKKGLLTDANFALSKALEAYPIWNEDSIISRGRELAQRATNIWKR